MENIPLPDTVSVVHEDGHEATFEIYPYFPGYGPTLGNALRRVLLSSLPGAAITAVRIDGAEHEFSALPGIAEDVVSILLNLKRVRIALHSDRSATLRLNVSGERVVTAGDIEKVADVEISNPDHVLAHLTTKDAKLSMELSVARGRGYVPVETREHEERPLSTIAIDAIYTPIERVSFRVENVRVGQATEYHKLILTLRTDGTVTPKAALAQAASILQDHFGALATDIKDRLTYRRDVPLAETTTVSASVTPLAAVPAQLPLLAVEERMVDAPIEGAVRAPEERLRDPKALPIVELPVPTRIQNILEKEGIKTLAGLTQKTRSQLLGVPGLGEKALEDIEAALQKFGDLKLREERKIE